MLKAAFVGQGVTGASCFSHISRLPSMEEYAAELCLFSDPQACCSSQQAMLVGMTLQEQVVMAEACNKR